MISGILISCIMKQKLRRLVRQPGTDGRSIEQPADDLKQILVLERDRQEQIVSIELGGNTLQRTTRRIRRNIEDFKSFSISRREYTTDHADSIVEGSTRTKDRLPSLDTHPTRGLGSNMAHGYSRSVDKGAANVFSTSARSYNLNTEISRGESVEQSGKPRKQFREVKALKPNIGKLPSLTTRPESKGKDITKRMMDVIAGRIKQAPRNVRRLKNFKTDNGGVGVFISDIGFTKTEDDQNAENEGLGLGFAGLDFMAGLQPLLGMFGQSDGNEEGDEDVEDLFKRNIDKIMVSNNILTGQELKEEQEFIYYIKLLYTDESQKHEFIYAINRKPEMPYNLTPVPFNVIQDMQPDYYYTVSKDRVIKHRLNRTVAEDSLMEEWLREKLKFNQLKTLELVRKFRKIKTLKRWIRNIKQFKRRYSAKLIEFKLPILDPMLCKPILEFRQRCIDMENLNYFYISNVRICSVEELKAMQDKTNDIFVNQIKQRDKLMNVFIREIVKNFNQLLWDTAFADLTEDLKGGLEAITCPDPSIYEDDVDIEGKDLAFFHKLMTLNVPYRVKSKIRSICHRLLTMPMFFDSLRFASLMNCYRYNIDRLRDHISRLRETNIDSKSVWQAKRGKAAAKRDEAYLTVYFELMTEYRPSVANIDNVDVVIAKGKTSAVDPLSFDYANNFEDRDLNLVDVSKFEMSKIDDSINIADLQTLMVKSYMYDRGIPETMNLQRIENPASNLISIKPSFDELKNFLLKEYDDFVQVLSSFKKCSVSGEFNLYFKIMVHWSNEDLRPDDDEELLNLGSAIDDRDRFKFEKNVIDPIEVDYNNVKSVSQEMSGIAVQHWRNCRADIEALRKVMPKHVGFLVSNLTESMEYITSKVSESLNTQIVMGSVNFSLESLQDAVVTLNKHRQKQLADIVKISVGEKTSNIKDWLKSNAELFNESIVDFIDFVTMKYREITISRSLINTRLLLNEYDEIMIIMRNSTYGSKMAGEQHSRVTEANVLCEGLINTISAIESSMTKLEDQYEVILSEKVDKTLKNLNELFQDVIDTELIETGITIDQAMTKMESLYERYDKYSIKIKDLVKSCRFLDFSVLIDTSIVTQIDLSLKYRKMLWQLTREIQELKDSIGHVEVQKLKIAEIDEFIAKNQTTIKTLSKHLPDCDRLSRTTEDLASIEQMSPVLKAMISPYLKASHIDELTEVYNRCAGGSTIEKLIEGNIAVAELEKLKIFDARQDITSISIRAYHEDYLSTMLKDLKRKWTKVNVPFGPLEMNPEITGITSLSTFNAEAEEGTEILNKILSNKYAKIIFKETEEFRLSIQRADEIVKKLYSLQTKYSFFDELFASPDMKKQMMTEGQAFDNAAKLFLANLKKVELISHALGLHRIHQLEDTLSKLSVAFDGMSSNLENHLNEKRQKFCRLYLMSDSELLDLLSNFYKNVNVFNKYLSKMFDSISSLRVVEDNGEYIINGLQSVNNEVINFEDAPFYSRGSLEEVLDQILTVMRTKMKQLIFKRYNELIESTRSVDIEKYDFEKPAKENLNQCTVVSIESYFSQLLINSIGKGEDGFVDSVLDTCLLNIEKIGMTLGMDELNELQRIRLSNFVMIMIKYRDMANYVVDNDIVEPNMFYFTSQLTYDLVPGQSLKVTFMDMEFDYEFEYVGCTERLVMTESMNATWSSVLLAINSKCSVCLMAAGGTAKLQIMTDLGHMLGKYCLPVHCNNYYSYKTLYQIWCLMENFDYLSKETISMCTQLLSELYISQKKGNIKLTFGTSTIDINPNFSIMLTMSNRQYTSLPSAMRESYRPLTIHRPDRQTVVRHLMMTSGFNREQELPSLVLKLIDCAKSQFYSRRVEVPLNELKAIVKEASDYLHKSNNERSALLSAINNYILPQLSGEDKYIWQMILINIFGPTSQQSNSDERAAVARSYFKVRSLVLSDETLSSILDCYEVMSRWKAVCVLDNDTTGKVVALECVKHMFGKLNQINVASRSIFPKAYPLHELYGNYENDQSTNQGVYKQGVIQRVVDELSKYFPSAMDEEAGRAHTVYNEKNIQRWLVFDGTASADWMAGLSTAMDNEDGFVILPNYEKMPIPANMRLVYKSSSIQHASAAAISRLGLITLSSTYCWKDNVAKVLESVAFDYPILNDRGIMKKIKDSVTKFFDFLFDSKITLGLEWSIKMPDNELVNNYLVGLNCLIRHFMENNYETDEHYLKLEAITSGMSFVTLWTAVGSLVLQNCQSKFEQIVEDKFIHYMRNDSKNLQSKCINPVTFTCDTCKKAFNPMIDHLGLESSLLPSGYHNLRVISPSARWRSVMATKILELKSHVMILTTPNSSIESVLSQTTKDLTSSNGMNMQRIRMKWTLEYEAKDLTDHLKDALTSKSKTQYIPMQQSGAIVVIEDINMPMPDKCSDIQSLERLRRLVVNKSFVDFSINEEVSFEGLNYLVTARACISNLEAIRRKQRKGFFVTMVAESSEQEFKDTIFEIVNRSCTGSFASYVTSDILAEISERASEIVWSIQSEGNRIIEQKIVPESSLESARLFDVTAGIISFKSALDKESEYLRVLINSLVCYLLSESINYEEAKPVVLSFIQHCLSKSYRGFEWSAFVIEHYPFNMTTDANGSLQISIGTNQNDFTGQVKKLLDKQKLEFEGYHLLPETVDCLYKTLIYLWQPGSRATICGLPGSGKVHMLKAAGLLLNMSVVTLELAADGDQKLLVKQQMTKIVTDCLVNKKRYFVLVNLSSIKNISILRILQDITLVGVSAWLDIDKSKLRDAMLMADYTKDQPTFLKDFLALNCRLLFIDDMLGSNNSIEHMNWYQLIRDSKRLTVDCWKQSSFERVAHEVIESYQDLDMQADSKRLSAAAITAIHTVSLEAARDTAAISQRSFELACRYMCDFKVKSKVEIRDQLRNIQTGVARFRSLLKLSDELKAKEKEVAAIVTVKNKELEALTKEIEAAQEEARKQKG